MRRRAWYEAYDRLSAADHDAPLGPEDLQSLATAAWLIGKDAEATHHWTRAHYDFLARHEPEPASRCAFWLAFGLLERGEPAQASGWLARARRLLDEGRRDCVELGYLLLPEALRLIDENDNVGASFGDPDLVALARHGQGRALLRLGKTGDGVRLLDEAMVAVTTGEVSPIVAGDVYCSVISGCQEIFDWRRAREWTAALARWCALQPDLVPFRGQCLLRRSEILELDGRWSDALDEARRACERLSRPPGQGGVGAAFYQVGELHRLRGESEAAEEAYREASLRGRRPQPGLALLRLAQGMIDAAVAAIVAALDEARAERTRARLLPAQVEIALAAKDVTMARAAAEELETIAAGLGAPCLRAMAGQAAGAVHLAEGNARPALAALREAESFWREAEVPYEAARTRALVALACRELGDPQGAEMELEGACSVLRRLGAVPELARVKRLGHPPASTRAHGLTVREVEVLRLVAAGKTNRGIAAQLRISEKTVARHLSNIFVKLGLSSRAAATAYAYEHALVQPGRSGAPEAPVAQKYPS